MQYVKDSSSFSSFELDYHDIESVIDENAKSFIKSNLMKKYDADKKSSHGNIKYRESKR
ncbi:hypothetical protein [Helicobacter bilis]|uniref:hypothetical protein n=1 Tax=Helicobacter bilis TaxID=37372 RepID=UPI000B008CD4|nr:hypothetical protein [Helicobacter bilis]